MRCLPHCPTQAVPVPSSQLTMLSMVTGTFLSLSLLVYGMLHYYYYARATSSRSLSPNIPSTAVVGMQIICKAVIIINQQVEIVSTSESPPKVRGPLTLSDLPIPLSLESSNIFDDSSEGFRNIH